MNTNTTRRIVCLRCAKIKQACDGGSPCARCKRLDVSCEPNEYGKQPGDSSGVISKPSRIIRTHTGCSSCKKRRRKCDEIRPRCSDCRRLCLDCHYSTQGPRHKPGARDGHDTPVIAESTSSASPIQPQPPALDQTILDFEDESLSESVDSTSWAELTELWPITSQSHMGLHLSDGGTTPSPQPDLSLVMMSAVPDISTDEDKSLLNHYMKVVAGVLSRRDDRQTNPYLTKILPMAFQNQLVMDAVLALSASHWRKMQPSVFRRGTIHQTNGKTRTSSSLF